MADGIIYRLITVGLWMGFCTGVLTLGLIIISINAGRIDSPMEIIEAFLFQEGAEVAFLMWAYPLMLGVQYVVEGEFKWLPWKR